MSNATTLQVRGHKVRTATQRRYVVVVVAPRDRTFQTKQFADGQFVDATVTVPANARIHKRSDSIETARKLARNYGVYSTGEFAVVVDTITGEEI